MVSWETAIRPPVLSATRHSILRLPDHIAPQPKNTKARIPASRISAALNSKGPNDPLLRAALTAASLRLQETLRPDPLFIDQYAGCFLTRNDSLVSLNVVSPLHYRLATKFIDDKLLTLTSSVEDLRQIVLLTGGMDTRPYRLCWPRSCVIYDVSPGSVFKVASEKLAGIGAKIPKNCMLLHIPLESPDLQTILCKKGFNGNSPSLWALQGLPLMNLANLKDILLVISGLAMQGSIVMGELPGWLLRTEFGDRFPIKKGMEKVFMSNAFQVDLVDYDEVSRNQHLDPLPGDNDNVLFIAKQLRLSDSQMESWRTHFQRIEEGADEEGFEEL